MLADDRARNATSRPAGPAVKPPAPLPARNARLDAPWFAPKRARGVKPTRRYLARSATRSTGRSVVAATSHQLSRKVSGHAANAVGDGRFIEDTTEGTLMGAPLWRRGWLGYSNMDQRYEWITIDSVNTTMMTYVGATGSGPKLPISMDGVFTDQGVAGEETCRQACRHPQPSCRIHSDDRHVFRPLFQAARRQGTC